MHFEYNNTVLSEGYYGLAFNGELETLDDNNFLIYGINPDIFIEDLII